MSLPGGGGERGLTDEPRARALRGQHRPQPHRAVPAQEQFALPVRAIPTVSCWVLAAGLAASQGGGGADGPVRAWQSGAPAGDRLAPCMARGRETTPDWLGLVAEGRGKLAHHAARCDLRLLTQREPTADGADQCFKTGTAATKTAYTAAEEAAQAVWTEVTGKTGASHCPWSIIGLSPGTPGH